jgi:hypothetical protein
MISKTLVFFGLLLCWCLIPRNALAGNDACKQKLPTELASAIAEQFPEYRLPRENDNLAEDVDWAREHGGSACLGATPGSYYSDGKIQWAVALRLKSNPDSSLVVVARPHRRGWIFDVLVQWPTLASRLYVAREQPGRYERGAREPASLNEPAQLDCEYDAIAIGETESGQSNYCRVAGRWLSITVAE